MVEVVVVAVAMGALLALAKQFRGNEHFETKPLLVVPMRDERGDDLPCPWCYAPTEEDDTRCSGCGRSFG